MELIQRVNHCQVLHFDVRSANVIVRNETQLPVLIDFGISRTKGTTPDEKWNDWVEGNEEVHAMRVILADRGLHLASPID